MLSCGLSLINYNSGSFLERALKTAVSQEESFAKIIVIDNASQDDSCLIASKFKEVELIACKKNSGYAAAANLAFQRLNTDIVLIANSDILLPVDFSKRARLFFEKHQQAAMLAPLLLRFDQKTIDSAGQDRSLSCFPREHCFNRKLDKVKLSCREVFSACGALLVMHRRLIEAVLDKEQLFDEDFFIFWEDFDLGWRLHKRGVRIFFEPQVFAYHFRSATLPKSVFSRIALSLARPAPIKYHIVKNRYLTLLKNFSLRTDWYRLPFILLKDLVWLPLMIAFSPSILLKCIRARHLFKRALIYRKNVCR